MAVQGDSVSRLVRGRVVMLVDNGVYGDSRVQKAAASAAAANWDVILLGRATDGVEKRWRIGDAEVRLVPMPSPLSKRRHEFRRRPLRAPLAYPQTGIAAHRSQHVRAWKADLIARRAEQTVRTRAGKKTSRTSRLGLRVQTRAARILGSWVSMRTKQVTKGAAARRRLDGPWDRLYMRFWMAVQRDRSWRKLEPRLWDFELAFGSVIDALKPDLIHANDFYMLGVGARATMRARAAGRPVKLVWDAHELVSGLKSRADNARWLPAHVAHEREYAKYADVAMTVSTELAETLQREHRLPVLPTVVLNAPSVGDDAPDPATIPDIRALAGIDAHTPLLVYSGAAAPQRGLGVMVEAMPYLEDVHVGFVVASPPSKYVLGLVARAEELGVQARLHLLPYVPHDQVVGFLSGADVGVIPIHKWPNHEIALITKFFEYAHARLPMVVSDVRTMAAATVQTGQGEVFRAEDVEDYVRAVNTVLSDPARYRAAYEREGLLEGWTWKAQAEILDDVYGQLVDESTTAHQQRIVTAGIPDVSVIIAVHNAMPYLTKCIRRLVEQTIGMDRFEVVAVDDGSTDGSGERLDSFAKKFPNTFKVTHQRNSGGPALPSNRALDRARGRYVFFIGADDYLGPEALERMVEAADEHGSDVLLAKMVGANGRYVPGKIFASNQVDVDLFNSALPYALSNTKLFRRDLIEKHGLRFPEGLPFGSDQPFTLEACLHAERISVLADYDYYFAVRRRDASNITYRSSREERLRCTEEIMKVAASLVEPGPRRDAIISRHFAMELTNLLRADFLELDRDVQHDLCAGIGRLVDEYMTEGISKHLDVSRRLRLHLARLGDLDTLLGVIGQDYGPDQPPIVVEGEDIYFGYECFRAPELSLPDSLFHITDSPAESIATRFAITGLSWAPDKDGRMSLSVVAHSPVDLTAFGPTPVTMHAGSVAGQVSLAVPRQRLGSEDPSQANSGTSVTARFPIEALIADFQPLGDRREVRVRLEVHGQPCDVPLRMPPGVGVTKQISRRGSRPYGIGPAKNRDGYLVIDIVPVTMSRLVRRVRTKVKLVRVRSDRRGQL